jgi:penicillin G amidase
MKSQRFTVRMVAVIFPLLVLPLFFKLSSSQTSVAPTTQEIAGLKARVTIRRDERGISYINANSDEDLYFSQGYVTASDRLWQMDLFRRTARGELAEVLGDKALEEDKRHRTMGFAQAADAEAAQASPKARAVLEAYASGVNAYIASLEPKSLPVEFQILQYKPRPWTPADSLIIVKLFYETLSSSWRLDVMREALRDLPAEKLALLLPETSPLDVLVIGKDVQKTETARRQALFENQVSRPHEDATLWHLLAEESSIEERSLARIGFHCDSLAASNNWVVSGKRTSSGKPLLANDPHLAPSAPPIWYLVHLSAPGVRVAGVTTAGLPGVVIGHNEHIAWGFTNVGPDVQDLYVEKFDPGNPQKYLTPTGWHDAEIRHEQIRVRKSFTDSASDTTTLDVTVTRHGPIIFERDGRRYALRWTALDPKLNNADGFYLQNRARNWKEFTTALGSYTGPMQNMVYADTEGHIGYYAAGRVPVRKSGDGSLPYDGSTDAGEWVSFIPFDKLPHLLDPPSGIIVTANQRIVGNDYPYFLTHSWAQPYRARRILDLLEKKQKWTPEDFRAVQGDVYSIAGVTFARNAAKILKGDSTSAENDSLREQLSAFETWDGLLTVNSKVAPLIAQMRIAFRDRVIRGAIGEERAKSFGWSNFDTTLDRLLSEQPAEWLPKEFTSYAALLRSCYTEAREALTKTMGNDETSWTWGNMVKSRFPHPLAGVPLIGLQFTIAPLPQNGTSFMLGATVNVGAAVSMRLIADPNDWDHTQQGITLGESSSPLSPHWKDQLDDWRAVTPRVFPFSESAIAAAARQTVVFQPRP